MILTPDGRKVSLWWDVLSHETVRTWYGTKNASELGGVTPGRIEYREVNSVFSLRTAHAGRNPSHSGQAPRNQTGIRVHRSLLYALAIVCVLLVPVESLALSPNDFFGIKLVNAKTGRGIPLATLRTNNDITFRTDNAGLAAIYEPGLMNRDVRLSVESSGYASSGPGWEDDVRVTFTPGESRTIEMTPHNVADRLYRQSGYGMYRDSHLLGEATPTDNPLLNNGKVLGQDSVNNAVFRGKLYWFWDDTQRLENDWLSRGTGATSPLPSEGGLNPEEGVNLDYFAGNHGKVVNVFPESMSSWIWLSSLLVVEDDSGREKMFSIYLDVEERRRGLARWNEHRKQWENVTKFPADPKIIRGNKVLRVRTEGKEWFYFARPYPTVRVPATAEALSDPDQYEALTPLREGTWLSDESVEQDGEGNPVWGWKSNTSSLNKVSHRRRLRRLDDFDTTYDLTPLRHVSEGGILRSHNGTVYWNEHRQKWIMVFGEAFGKFTWLGDLWYAEADSPIGPWAYARRVVRHKNHACYNVKQHRMLDQLDGQHVFFECTYASWFSQGQSTPHYGYNQMMYSLDLSEEPLHLPSPVYHYQDREGAHRYDTLKGLRSQGGNLDADSVAKNAPIPFYTLPRDRPRSGSVPVWQKRVGSDAVELTLREPRSDRNDVDPAFYAYPPNAEVDNPHLVTIYEFEHQTSGRLMYGPSDPGSGWNRSHAAFLAWESPNRFPPREPGAEAVKTCMGASAVCEAKPDVRP